MGKILLYGGKSTALIVYEMLKEKNKTVSYIFDEYLNNTHFKNKAVFSNKKYDFRSFIKKSKFFFVCIGMYDGKLRNFISKILIDRGLKPLSITSSKSLIYDKTKIGHGLLAMPNSVVHRKALTWPPFFCFSHTRGTHRPATACIPERVPRPAHTQAGTRAWSPQP